MQDILNTQNRLQQLYDEYFSAYQKFNEQIDGEPISTEQEQFTTDANIVLQDMQMLQHKVSNMVEKYGAVIWKDAAVVQSQPPKPFSYSSFISQQHELMQQVEKVLKFPLRVDTRLIAALLELVYKVPAGSGLPEWYRKELKMFMVAISGWMLIKRYGGEFVIQNKLCVRLYKVPFIIELENRLTISTNEKSLVYRFDDWFEMLVTNLDHFYTDGTMIEAMRGVRSV